ncbi:MAG: AEC family transporter [Desulfuromonadaceae bacterium]
MILETLFPIIALVVLGYGVRRTEFVPLEFFRASDKLVYFIFFPAMLFWKVSTATGSDAVDASLIWAGIAAVSAVFLASTVFILKGGVAPFQAGSFSQSCYRFNTYIGMAVVLQAMGDAGVVQFAVLVGILIPIINVMAVTILIWFSGQEMTRAQKQRYLVRALASNPLIIACVAGLLLSASGLALPAFVNNTFSLASMVALPLALISIGSAFSFKHLPGYFRLSGVAVLFKLVMLPLVGAACLYLFGVEGSAFKAAMIFFCLPTSTAIYVLSSQLNSDTHLASASIVLSTMASFVSLSLVLWWI